MKITATILAAAGLVATATACASTVTVRQAAAVKAVLPPVTTPNGPTVTVIGTGSAAGTPDQASMSFGVEVNASSAADALSGEASAARSLISAIKRAGIADADIQTEWVSLYPDSQHGGYTASSSVSAKIRQLGRAGSIIDAAVAAAGNDVRLSGISLSIADTSSLMAAARKQAVADAQSKAEQYATAAGMKLGGIVSISEAGSSPLPVPYDLQGASAASQPIEAGQQTLDVSVTVVYSLV